MNTQRSPFHTLSSFVRSHDDLPAFNAAYWILTFLAAMFFNAGAFALLIAGHMALDVYKYRDIHGKKWSKVVEGVLRESLLDLSLLSLSISFGVYFHHTLPIVAGLRGLLRTEIVIIDAVLEIVMKAHILHNVLTIFSNLHQYLQFVHPRMGRSLSLLEVVAATGLLVSFVLTLLSPWILGLQAADVSRLAHEMLIPWNL